MATSSAGASVRLIHSHRSSPETTIAPVMSPARTSAATPSSAPGDYNLAALHKMLDQVVAWSAPLAPLRVARRADAA